MRLAIDLDDVTADFMTTLVQALGEPDRWDIYSLEKMYPDLDPEEIAKEVYSKETYSKLRPMPGAVRSINTIQNIFPELEIYYVTARRKSIRRVTLYWLNRHSFPNRHKLIMTGGHRAKEELFMSGDFWGAVDDRGSTLLSARNYLEHAFLFNQPWNVGYQSLERVLNWNHLMIRLGRAYESGIR